MLFLTAALAIFVAQTALLAAANYVVERWSGGAATRNLAIDGTAVLVIAVAIVVGVRRFRARRRIE